MHPQTCACPLHNFSGGLYINAGRKLLQGTPSLFSTYLLMSFFNNHAMVGGGAYLSENDFAYVQHCEFVNNVAMSGGGLTVYSPQVRTGLGFTQRADCIQSAGAHGMGSDG